MTIQVRPPAADLVNKNRFQRDEAIFALVLLALTSFHGFTMTPQWTRLNQVLRADTGWSSGLIFTVLMAAMIVAPMLLFWVSAAASRRLVDERGISTYQIFRAFAYSILPVALFYHLAHNCMHFFIEGGALVPLLSDPFGRGWNLFGTADWTVAPLLSLTTIWWLQVGFIVIGHVYGVIVSDRIARRLFASEVDRGRVLIPHLAIMVLYSSFSIWLVAQPMDMRTGM